MTSTNFNDIKHLLNKESIIFDVGSNIGNFSKYIVDSGLYKKIYLFEPISTYINKSKLLLKDSNCEFINNGLSNKTEKLTLYMDDKNIGWNTFLKKDPNQNPDFYLYMKKQETSLITLDSYCDINNINKIDLVKIDVEGFECRVLEGFMNTLLKLKKKPYLYIEVGWGTNHPEWNYCYNIYEKIFELGYNRIDFTTKTADILFSPIQ